MLAGIIYLGVIRLLSPEKNIKWNSEVYSPPFWLTRGQARFPLYKCVWFIIMIFKCLRFVQIVTRVLADTPEARVANNRSR